MLSWTILFLNQEVICCLEKYEKYFLKLRKKNTNGKKKYLVLRK